MGEVEGWSEVENRLISRGFTIPVYTAPTSRHLPLRRSGGLCLLAGILPKLSDGSLGRGALGADLTDEDGREHALALGLTTISALREHFADPSRLAILECVLYVRSTPEYTEHHRAADVFSGLLIDSIGENAEHARTTVGVPALALGASMEVRCSVEYPDA